jgi:hypothetical protein
VIIALVVIAVLIVLARLFGGVPYVKNLLLAIDILGSAVLAGMPGETLSGRAGTAQRQGRLRGRILAPIINFIMGSKTHCLDAIDGDIQRAKAVIVDDAR